MISDIKDFKNRTLVESNTLKTFILSASKQFSPKLDDILIHDYQIANSVTINSILSNFIVNLKHAWNLIDTKTNENEVESYFKIIDSIENVSELPDETRMFLNMNERNFSMREMKLVSKDDIQIDNRTRKILNLDTHWYGFVLHQTMHNSETDNEHDYGLINVSSGLEYYQYERGDEPERNGNINIFEHAIVYDQIKLIDALNDDNTSNPFDAPLYCSEQNDLGEFFTQHPQGSFNDYLKYSANLTKKPIMINCIIKNEFYGNSFGDDYNDNDNVFGLISRCKFLVCLTTGFWGLVPKKDDETGSIIFELVNLGIRIPNIVYNRNLKFPYEFTYCGFHSIDDETTLFMVMQDENKNQKYLYLNGSSFDRVYGFTEVKSLVVDGQVFNIPDIIRNINSMNELNTLSIIMSDYGFWDIEKNNTNDITYSFSDARKTYDTLSVGWNNRQDKVILPTVVPPDNSKVVGYNMIWELKNGKYEYEGVKFPQRILSDNQFMGGNKGYSVYDKFNDDNPYLLAYMDPETFRKLLFSNNDLATVVLTWLYDHVTFPSKGEKYLELKHSDMCDEYNNLKDIDFDESEYQLKQSDNKLNSRFSSAVANLISQENGFSASNKIQSYCNILYKNIIKGNKDETWVFNDVGSLETTIQDYYKSEVLQVETITGMIVQGLVNKFPQLAYFKTYLTNHIWEHVRNPSSVNVDVTNYKDIVSSVIGYIDELTPAMQVLGSYDSSKQGNACYSEIDNYFYWNKINLAKDDISQILSAMNAKDAIIQVVNEIPFFKDNQTYAALQNIRDNNNQFKIGSEVEFIGLSKFINSDQQLNVSWNDIKGWLFNNDNVSDDKLLNEFIRAFIYRPLFFKHDGYSTNFSTNENKYKCYTNTSYLNHEQETHELVFTTDSTGKKIIDVSRSGLNKSNISSIQYHDNVLSYQVTSGSIDIVDDKFIYNDCEYFVTRLSGSKTICSVYFNEFNPQQPDIVSKIELNKDADADTYYFNDGDNTRYDITKDGVMYMSRLDSDRNIIDNFGTEFKQEIVNDVFKLNGVLYKLQRDDAGEFVSANYVMVDDNKLKHVLINSSGKGTYQNDITGEYIEFIFTSDTVQIINHYRTNIIYQVKSEWCENDENHLTIDNENGKTYEWLAARTISRVYDENPGLIENILRFSNGMIYEGCFDRGTCEVSFEHQLKNERVYTNCILEFEYEQDGETINHRYDIGTILNEQLQYVSGKKIFGKIGEDGLYDGTGDDILILKDLSKGKNSLNCVSIPKSEWIIPESWEEEGEAERDTETNMIKCSISGTEIRFNNIDSNRWQMFVGEETSSNVIVQAYDNNISFIYDSERYYLNIRTNKVYYVQMGSMPATALEFDLQYVPTVLKNNLAMNLKQLMFNRVCQSIMDSTESSSNASIHILMGADELGKYLELLSDENALRIFSSVRNVDETSDEYRTYANIFKNHIEQIDDGKIQYGNICNKLRDVITNNFQDSEFIRLVNKPSISVARNSDGFDEFTYDAYLDLTVNLNKNILKNTDGSINLSYNDKFVVARATVHNVHVFVTFKPTYTSNTLRWDVQYKIDDVNEYRATYDTISYVKDEQLKQKTIPAREITINLSQLSSNESDVNKIFYPDELSEEFTGTYSSYMLSEKLEDVFTTQYLYSVIYGINSKNYENYPTDKISIKSLLLQNYNQGDNIWNFGELMPSDANVSLSKRGTARINNVIYHVNDNDDKLISTVNGYNDFDIVKLNVNELKSSEFDESGRPIRWEWETEPSNLPIKYIAVDKTTPIVTSDYISGNFRFTKIPKTTNENNANLVQELSQIVGEFTASDKYDPAYSSVSINNSDSEYKDSYETPTTNQEYVDGSVVGNKWLIITRKDNTTGEGSGDVQINWYMVDTELSSTTEPISISISTPSTLTINDTELTQSIDDVVRINGEDVVVHLSGTGTIEGESVEIEAYRDYTPGHWNVLPARLTDEEKTAEGVEFRVGDGYYKVEGEGEERTETKIGDKDGNRLLDENGNPINNPPWSNWVTDGASEGNDIIQIDMYEGEPPNISSNVIYVEKHNDTSEYSLFIIKRGDSNPFKAYTDSVKDDATKEVLLVDRPYDEYHTSKTEQILGPDMKEDTMYRVTFETGFVDSGDSGDSVDSDASESKTWEKEIILAGSKMNNSGHEYADMNWYGVNGKVKIQFRQNPAVNSEENPEDNSEENLDSILATIDGDDADNKNCILVDESMRGENVVSCYEYEPKSVSIISIEEEKTEHPEDNTKTNTQYTVTFKISFDVHAKMIAEKPESGQEYYDNGLHIRNTKVGERSVLSVKSIIMLYDVDGSSSGELGYGITYMPINISSDRSQTYDDLIIKPVFIENTTINDGKISQPGYYAPCKVGVIAYDKIPENEGDIYNRYYAKSQDVQVGISELPVYQESFNSLVKMNKANTKKSIKIANYDQFIDRFNDSYIPSLMKVKIENKLIQLLKLNKVYFGQVLLQLQSFIELIDNEINRTITTSDICGLCNFNFKPDVTFQNHYGAWNSDSGLFGYTDSTYTDCIDQFNQHLKTSFIQQHSVLDFNEVEELRVVHGDDSTYGENDYLYAIDPTTLESINNTGNKSIYGVKINKLNELFRYVCEPRSSDDPIATMFIKESDDEKVRYINAIPTTMVGNVQCVYVFDNLTHVFTKSDDNVYWYQIDGRTSFGKSLLEKKKQSYNSNSEYVYEPEIKLTQYKINPNPNSNWILRFANRDLLQADQDLLQADQTNIISDAFIIRCIDSNQDLWYLSELDVYIHSKYQIKDMAYEQNGKTLYVIYDEDNLIYQYSLLGNMDVGSDRKLAISKETATRRINTFHSVSITETVPNELNFIYLDYTNRDDGNVVWTMKIYGILGDVHDIEVWSDSPGTHGSDFATYNNIMFGDSMFNEGQLKFHNISKNKEMFDILDINEVDGCFYGLFRDNVKTQQAGVDSYTIFKTPPDSNGVVKRIPYDVAFPKMFRTGDNLYSLFSVVRSPNGYEVDENGDFILDEDEKKIPKYDISLREISVPDSEPYSDRVIELQKILGDDNLNIVDMMMSSFVTKSKDSSFLVLLNNGLHRIGYKNVISQLSVDTLDKFKELVKESLKSSIMKKHEEQYHNNSTYLGQILRKIKQRDDRFTVFELIPTEFGQTQDVGVIPSGKVVDGDSVIDHRMDSIIVSTDVLQSDGMIIDSDINPGFITCAVSNPATMYDDDNVFMKVQRNPSLEGTEFYDFIHDANGNTLMDLYAVPFIYKINSNNTYDLYINVPTTRTKYINRLAGTLKSDLTSQVLPDDARIRRNFMDESIPNNLTETTTKLRVYIDRKFVSIGNVEFAEISGNSIPLQIYRDVPNQGLYDSIALEGRWNGEFVEINQPSKDINKVMLEFEVYGTDSQSIHITGKTLINSFLNKSKYRFG